MDFGFFGCQNVSISFAVTNKYGISNFSVPTATCIHGGMKDLVYTYIS